MQLARAAIVSSWATGERGIIETVMSCSRNRRASVSLSPTLALFVAPYGKLYLRLQELVPENESVRASTPPKTMASSIEIADVFLQATNFANECPKYPVQGNLLPITLINNPLVTLMRGQ